MVHTTTHRKINRMPKKIRKIEAPRKRIVFPAFALEDRPVVCPLDATGHPLHHYISVHETLVPCRVTQP